MIRFWNEELRNGRKVGHKVAAACKSAKGAGAVSMILIIPAVVLFVELAMFGGRLAGAHGEIQSAARQSAREASFAAGPGSAQGLAEDVADLTLVNASFRCISPTTTLLGSGNFVAGGTVEIQVSCLVSFDDLTRLPIPGGGVTVRRSAVEPIDPFRVIE